MAKLIPLSIIIVSVVIPAFLASGPKPAAKLRLMLFLVIGYILIWTQLVLRVYPVYVPLD
jgi:hypothetical protein